MDEQCELPDKTAQHGGYNNVCHGRIQIREQFKNEHKPL